MKKIIAIIAIAIATIATANAKVVKGHVNDRDGYPVEGIRIAVVDEDNNGKRTIIRTDENGCHHYYSKNIAFFHISRKDRQGDVWS